MTYRYDDFAPGNIYHIHSRGVEQRDIFLDSADRHRFVALLTHCLPREKILSYSISKRLKQHTNRTSSGKGNVDILCYCLMTNHFHLLLKENVTGGISTYTQRLLNSYAKYFNARQQRIGSLFIRPFRAVWVDDDDQLLHVSRYIHLNPYVAHMVKNPFAHSWSSLNEYINREKSSNHCHTNLIKTMMRAVEYKAFIANEADYARELGDIKHLLLDDEH
jgi:putative transposase